MFEDALRALEEFGEQGSSWEMAYDDLSARYAAALPDDLPVIPKAVGEYIRKAKKPRQWGLLDVFWHLGDHISAMGFNGSVRLGTLDD